jgi:hypothetical protein
MRTWIAGWTIGAALMSASATSAQDVPGLLEVTGHVTDYVNLPANELADAEAHATAAYRAAGIDLLWSSQPLGAADGATDTASQSIDVRVVIVPKGMAEKKCRAEGLKAGVMGVAISTATEASGRIAYIFYDRIQHVAVSRHTPLVRGLGHVIAHEIGHLLIGRNSHSDEGLMRPNWNPRDNRVQTLTEGQVQQIWHRFATLN